MTILIRNGFVYDPINGINGEKMDIHIGNGKIIENVNNPDFVYDASGKIVMAGGFDVHSHVAGGNLTTARTLRPEDNRKGVKEKGPFTRAEGGAGLPSAFATGYRYIKMGYTFLLQPGMPPLSARQTHDELNDIPIVDKTALVLTEKNWFMMRAFMEEDWDFAARFMAWLNWATKASGTKIVAPGSTEAWAWGKSCKNIDDEVPRWNITPKDIFLGLGKANEMLNIPHSIHLHLNALGIPGNAAVTLESIQALDSLSKSSVVARDQIAHLTHLQFNAYGGESWKTFQSGTEEICKAINKRNNITTDVGAITPGDWTTLTADGPTEYFLSRLNGLKWCNLDTEFETGAGCVPFVYSLKNRANAIQWAIGLELFLLIDDPWKVMLTTDHPNSGPFTDYPIIMSWLMSKAERDRTMKEKCQKDLGSKSIIASLDREYDLYELAIITRSAGSKCFGLETKGHLGVGADADIAVYDFNPEKQDPSKEPQTIRRAFSSAAFVVKSGLPIVRDGEIIAEAPPGTTWYLDLPQREGVEEEISEFFKKYYSVSLNNYPIRESFLRHSAKIPLPSLSD
ncbi:MAG: formylmethanofuran dehydrogenase subunit A [Candidatus Heimdallarchaeota archaeon]